MRYVLDCDPTTRLLESDPAPPLAGEWQVWRTQRERNQALDQALAASRAKGQFLANMSHEIRTPLNGVLRMIELLLLGGLKADQEHLAQRAYESGQALLLILNDILDISKIEVGKMALETVSFDLSETARSVITLLEPGATAAGTRLLLNLDPQLPSQVRGDPMRLRQVLVNLVSNGIKFTEQRQVTLTVARAPDVLPDHDAGAVPVAVEVADTGIGMSAAVVDRLFQPFTQADSSMTRRYGGTGLGLSIVKELVSLMGGNIHVTSTPGNGTRFRIRIDFAAAPVAEPASAAPMETPTVTHAPSTATAGALCNTVRILLAEDNPVNREVALAMLDSLGCRCVTAENGALAVDAFSRDIFDVVLMDCQMPEMNGFDSTAAIRRLERDWCLTKATSRVRTPIIALTANALVGDREQCLNAGMDDFLAKPYSRDDLAAALRRVGARP